MEKILDKVRKLLAKASDPSVTEAEAASYAAKAQEILAAHNLAISDVPEVEREDGVEQETIVLRYGETGWRKRIAIETAKLYFCQMVQTKVYDKDADGHFVFPLRSKRGYIFVGRPHNVAVAIEMTHYLVSTVERLAKAYAKTNGLSHRARVEFENGCGERLSNRIYRLWWEQTHPETVTTGNGLPALYRSEDDLISAFLDSNMKIRRVAVRSGNSDSAHGDAGRAAGDKVSLSPQVAASNRSAGRLLK